MSDDYSADTQTTGTVTVGGSATGTIETSRDVDWFAVELVAGRTYVIDLEGAAAGGGTLTDTLLFGVFDDEGSRLSRKSGVGGEGDDARLVFTASETGTHYIAAKGSRKADTGTYTVQVREHDADATAAGAADLGDLAGEWVVRRDSVDGGDDAADYYRFTLDETQVVTLRLRQQDADADLYLEDGDGTVLHASTRDGTRGEDIRAALQAGTYYVRVAAQEAGDNGYLLRARAEDVPAAPQNALQNAASRLNVDKDATRDGAYDLGNVWSDPHTTNSYTLDGWGVKVDGESDVTDYYRFATPSYQIVTFSLKGQDFDADLYLEDATGKVLASSTKDGTSDETVSVGLDAGTYYLRVVAQEKGKNDYKLEYSAKYPFVTPDKLAAVKVAVGSSVTGEIEEVLERDWFAIEMKAGTTYQIDLKGKSTGDGTLVNPVLDNVFNSKGHLHYPFTGSDANMKVWDSGTGYNDRAVFTPDADGIWYFDVIANYWDGTEHRGTYTLSVEEVVDAM